MKKFTYYIPNYKKIRATVISEWQTGRWIYHYYIEKKFIIWWPVSHHVETEPHSERAIGIKATRILKDYLNITVQW